METVYEKIGLRRVINASGHVTALGVSAISDEVGQTMLQAAQNFVIVDELIDRVGQLISTHTGAEDTCVCSSATAGILISTAATVAGDDLGLIQRMPDSQGLKNEIIIQKGQAISFGIPITQLIRMGGGVPVEVGSANKTFVSHIESAISEKTAALMCVKSHHVQQESTASLQEMVDIAHAHGLPIILDAAAEEDLKKYVAMGFDMVIYSGAKAVEAPSSGFITGKKKYIDLCKKQYEGVGRAAKIGKECMTGLAKAVEIYDAKDHAMESERQQNILDTLTAGLQGIDSLKVGIEADDAGRDIRRVRLDVIPGKSKYTAKELTAKLQSGTPAIYTRNTFISSGTIFVDPRTMLPGDAELIIQRIKELL